MTKSEHSMKEATKQPSEPVDASLWREIRRACELHMLGSPICCYPWCKCAVPELELACDTRPEGTNESSSRN